MLPPGPRTPAIVQTYRYIVHPAPYARALRERWGDAVRFRTFNGDGVAVFSPALAKEVFAAPPDTFETMPVVGNIFGAQAVIATSGTTHRRQRKLLNPRFHGARVRALIGAMETAVRRHLSTFELASRTGEVIVMNDLAQAMTLDVILETVFGASADLDRERARRTLVELVHGFSPALISTRALHGPWFPPWRRFTRARAAFDAWIDGLVAERRTRGDLGEDVLGILLEARYEDGEPMSPDEIRDQLLTLLLAGHETSAVAFAWGTYWLAREPAVLQSLREAIDPLGPSPAPEALARLPYLEAVVAETLRIEPIVTDVLRVCKKPLSLGDWTVPAGDLVAVMLGSILKDPRVYPDPERFRPERFLDKTYGPSEFLPFGGGARRCLGAAFAESELALALGVLASDWEIELADALPERAVRRNLTMGPARGVRVRVRGPRAAGRAASPRDAGPERGQAAKVG